MTDENTGQRTIKFEDEGALDTFIAMSGLRGEQADDLREKVEKHEYGTPIPIPEPDGEDI